MREAHTTIIQLLMYDYDNVHVDKDVVVDDHGDDDDDDTATMLLSISYLCSL